MTLITTKKTNLPVTEAPTMTSLEMVDYINADRKAKAEAEGLTFPCKKYTRLQHKHFAESPESIRGRTLSQIFGSVQR